MKKIIKNRIFIFILGGIIFSTLSVGAVSLIYSKDVTYDNTLSGLKATTVQGALDELYESAKNGGAKVSCNDNGECTVTCKQGSPTMNDNSYSCTNTTSVTCPKDKIFVATSNGYKCTKAKDIILNNETIVTTGDGLYKDTVTEERYFYRGSSVNNYITFNDETWRIISIESDDTLKIVSNKQLPSTYRWDYPGNRKSSTNTYCTDNLVNYGCNAWAATSNLIGEPSTFEQSYHNGTVTVDATLNTYLNGTYYNSLSNDAKSKVVKGIFNVATPGDNWDTESLETDAQQEKQYQWQGYVALYTVTELLRASTDTNCTNLKKGFNSYNTSPCRNNNWLWATPLNTSSLEWTLSPYSGSNYSIWAILSSIGYISYNGAPNDNSSGYFGVKPVIYLTSKISLSGTGSSSDPYQIN